METPAPRHLKCHCHRVMRRVMSNPQAKRSLMNTCGPNWALKNKPHYFEKRRCLRIVHFGFAAILQGVTGILPPFADNSLEIL
jgi:hypothetical protein